MKDFLIRHRLIIIIPVVVMAVIIVSMIIGRQRRGDILGEPQTGPGGRVLSENGYFSMQHYPVNTKEQADGSLVITADGSATPELTWDFEVNDPDMIEAEAEGPEEGGILSIRVSPIMDGYASITLRRVGQIDGTDYMAAEIAVNMIVNLYDDGTMAVAMSDIYEYASVAGASDSGSPFIIEDARILLPKGGDWKVMETTTEGKKAAGIFQIYRGIDDNGSEYIGIYTEVEPYNFIIADSLRDAAEGADETTEEIQEEIQEEIPEEISEEILEEMQKELEESEEADSEEIDSDGERATAEEIADARLILRSKSLDEGYILSYHIDANNQGFLKIEDETEALAAATELADASE